MTIEHCAPATLHRSELGRLACPRNSLQLDGRGWVIDVMRCLRSVSTAPLACVKPDSCEVAQFRDPVRSDRLADLALKQWKSQQESQCRPAFPRMDSHERGEHLAPARSFADLDDLDGCTGLRNSPAPQHQGDLAFVLGGQRVGTICLGSIDVAEISSLLIQPPVLAGEQFSEEHY